MSDLNDAITKHVEEIIIAAKEERAKQEAEQEARLAKAAERRQKQEEDAKLGCITISVEQARLLAVTLVNAGFSSKPDFGGIRRFSHGYLKTPFVTIAPRYEEGFPGIQGYDVYSTGYSGGLGFTAFVESIEKLGLRMRSM